MTGKIAFQKWHHRAEGETHSLVFPDGCRDVLIVSSVGVRNHIVLTEFDFRPRGVRLRPGTKITGYRLRPGAVISPSTLDAIAMEGADVEEVLGNALALANELDDVIAALTLPGSTVQSVSKSCGISVRTMQRRFRQSCLPPPDYWRLLARARRAAGMLSSPLPLAELACACDFSDQAHMTRELISWFGGAPTQLRRDPAILDLLRQPALGNWTGEQISTR